VNEPTVSQSGITDVTFGKNVKIVQPSNLYGCSIGDDCSIGPFVEIQNDVTIGRGCKIQSHAFICELVTIGDNCFISHGAKFINDLFQSGKPAGGDKTKWRSTNIGNNVSIGTNATILPVSITDNVVVGAGAVVARDITESGTYVGNPAKKVRA